MNDSANDNRNHDDRPVTGDRLDALLRAWHDENRTAAEAMRGDMLRALADERAAAKRGPIAGRIGFLRAVAAAALLALATVLGVLFLSSTEKEAFADGGLVQVAEGGALDALDADGNALGPCPLQRTEVKVEISGLFARTIVEQTYANPYPRTIEAVYTFPLSERAAVDRMTMVVRGESGEKIVEGEVRERSIARAIYEEARESGYVASLLEQERPNIFTQSVANIEPGATVKVRIATIEVARRRDGVAEYVFPMVVGPRYIPGASKPMPTLPEGWEIRPGVVLRAPAGIEIATETPFPAGRMLALLEAALPVRAAKNESIDELLTQGEGIRFSAKYGNGSAERGTYWPSRGIGEINGRFFHAVTSDAQGTGFAGDTDRVPDASRITPMPVKPSERAGHDIGVSVTIDSGGPAITDVSSELHAVRVESTGATSRTVALEDRRTIPNRDFILRWKVADAAIEPSFFAHVSSSADPVAKGGYFALMLEPPARVAPAEVRPRELVFVLDTSGSMNGFPIEKSKELARKAIAAMRPNDTFNFITFAGATSVLWPEPRPASEENRRAADAFIDGLFGSGGTEMMTAINTALVQEGRSGIAPARLLDLPADGRAVRVAVPDGAIATLDGTTRLDAGEGRFIRVDLSIAIPSNPKKLALIVDGSWTTLDGERVLAMRSAKFEDADARTRMVCFLTDGYIGNDQAVVAAVGENARASRVFTFGIGNSVNRFLLEEMARAGRGTCEIVTLATEADAVVARLVRRIESPVLTDIALDVPASLGIRGLLPGGEHLPDLYDQEPIVLLGRFDRAATGVITIRGRTGAGAWEKQVTVALPEAETRHDVVPTLWARGQVDALLAPKLAYVEQGTLDAPTKREVIRLGETYRIATPFTSFVAVERSRVVVGGKPMLVAVPVELPEGTNWAGFFGEGVPASVALRSGLGDVPSLEKLDRFLGFAGDSTRDSLDEVAPAKEAETLQLGVAVGAAPPPAEKAKADPAMLADDKRRESSFGAPGRPPLPPASSSAPMGSGGIAPAAGPGGPTGGMTGGLVGGGGGFGGRGANAPAPVVANTADPLAAGGDSLERRRGQRPAGGLAGKREPSSGAASTERFSRGLSELSEGAAPTDAPMQAPDDSGEPASSEQPTIDRDRFVRVFELRLLPVAMASVVAPDDAEGLVESLGIPAKDGTVMLVVLVSELDDAVRKALADAGFQVDGTLDAKRASGRVVVGRMQPASLAKLADIKAVRRVEIARPSEAEAR